MPILTFWGVTPSGASARAVLACCKGHFRCFWGSKMAGGKVIHIFHKGGLTQRREEKKRERGTGNREPAFVPASRNYGGQAGNGGNGRGHFQP